tara:strand:- start:1387 stop:1962 length:576 start_codon:yes stop_codon:yes gene_type:complete
MKWIIIIGIIILLGIGFFLITSGDDSQELETSTPPTTKSESLSDANTKEGNVNWRIIELTDIRTSNKFTIDEFDKPILLESFAVWCPTCTRQQKEIKELHEELGDSFISISLDTDPNEDSQKVLDHIKRNDFTWRYAIAPKELTQSLIEEFGVTVVNAPQAPVILIGKNKDAKLLHNGVKSSSELKGELGL